MRIVSIDQSIRSSGVCIYDTQKDSYKFQLVGAPKEIKEPLQQVLYTQQALQELIITQKPDQVLIEGLPYGLNSTSVRPLAYLYYSINAFCYYWGIPIETIAITTAKKQAGKGNMKKDEMFKNIPEAVKWEMFKVTRLKKPLLDLSDAYWILQSFLASLQTNP